MLDRITYLIERKVSGLLTNAEAYELNELFTEDNRDALSSVIAGMLLDNGEILLQDHDTWSQRISQIVNTDRGNASVKTIDGVYILKTAWFRWAAAILLLVAGASIYYTFSYTKSSSKAVQARSSQQDILPGTNRAILILSDGNKITLDSAASETISDGNLSIENNQGQLSYKNADVAVVNTMTTPKGGQYQLILSDGTKVWLNAASSITYPAAFKGKRREISITGEAYFEVTTNKEKPFIVKTISGDVIVLGTSFNVNSYNDESSLKVSLVQGSVKIDEKILRPGQAYTKGIIVPTNIQQDIAWKNGAFYFTDMDMRTVFRQLERWYNISVKYDGDLPAAKLRGQMGRDFTLFQVLRAFKEIGINTRLEGNTLIVLSK